MTDWRIRYYIATGQLGAESDCGFRYSPAVIPDTELAQLRHHARSSGNVMIVDEMYGDDTIWEFGGKMGSVSRRRTPVTEFWANVYVDGTGDSVVVYDGFKANYPGKSTAIE
jgi:hypothetical protein